MIQIQKLTKTFGDFTALHAVDLAIKKGEVVILNGVSGSGKSTLLSLIAALQKPTSGEILIDQTPIAKLPQHHASRFRLEHIGFTPQDFKLIPTLSIYENILLPLVPLGLSPSQIDSRIREVISLIPIGKDLTHTAKDLSGGEKQRVAIARSLAADPDLLLFDEPTANLDSGNAERFLTLLKKLHRLGKTILIATHDPIFDHLPLPTRTIYMRQGRIVDAL